MINISISTNMLVIISCLILFIIVGIIVYIIYKDKKIDQEEIEDLIDDIVKAKPRKEEVQVKQIEIEPEKSQINLEEMLNQMQSNLEKKNENQIERFEQDQEENAIISYKELIKAADKMTKVEDYEQDQQENAIISFSELTKQKANLDFLEEKEDLIKKPIKKAIAKIESPREEKDKKFKNTEFISPIYGKMEEHIEYPKIKAYDKNDDLSLNSYFGKEVNHYHSEKDELEKMLNTNSLNDEINKNADFLQALKEFRNNL